MVPSFRRFGLLFAALLIAAGFLFLFATSKPDNRYQAGYHQMPQALPIDELTKAERVIDYLQKHQRLPDYYITKQEAYRLGWNVRVGNLCTIAPNKAIGGDRFMNREKKLPNHAKRQWFEADINYHCGHRGAQRLVYSNDGLIYLSKDHYKTFQQVKK